MSFFGAMRILVATRTDAPDTVDREIPPEMVPGTWAAWAKPAGRDHPWVTRLGDACRTAAGREGRLVEITERGRSWFICLEP